MGKMVNLKLVKDWRCVLKRYWSFRFSVLSAVLGGIEVYIQLRADDLEPLFPKGVFAGIAAVVSLLAALSRPIAQKKK